MSVWERHGIYTFSASSLNLYRNAPGVWCLRYLLKVRDDAGPGAWRGQAVEAGLDRVLFDQADFDVALKATQDRWDELAQGQADDKALEEYNALPGFLEQAIKAFDGKRAMTRQSKIKLQLDELDLPIIGYVDYRFEKEGYDLKTTNRLPSSPKQDHVDQVSIYSRATGLPFYLAYVTAKKWATYEVTETQVGEAIARVIETANSLKHMLSKCKDGKDAFKMFANDTSSFYWSPPLLEAAREIYKGK